MRGDDDGSGGPLPTTPVPMLAPIDFSHVEQTLATPLGWADLGLVVVSLGIAWLVDRRVWRAREASGDQGSLRGSVARVVLPLTALLLVLIAAGAYRRYAGPPFFLAVAAPLLVALAAIRMIVYGLRRLFRSQSWVPTSERAIAFAIWGFVILYFLGLLPEMVDALDEIQIPIGRTRTSLLSIGTAILVVVFTLIVTLWISGFIEQRLLRATHFDVNLRVVLGKFLRATLLIVGVLISLQAIGFDLTLLSVFGGALGVGIGLGLQKLASNYIAGFTLLLDRSIRLGDMVTVDGRYGAVAKVTSRYVVVRSLDGVEAIVPNETLVTTTVLNHSYTTRNIRIAVQVQVSGDSDVERALTLMEEIARRHPRVRNEPDPPTAYLANFVDNGVNLELGVWIGDPEKGQLNLKSALNREIFAAFRENGIKQPFPQLDVRQIDTPSARPASPDAAKPTEDRVPNAKDKS
jgi:small-conductance mechanosensitive channel